MSKIVVIGSINKDVVFSVDRFVQAKETLTSNEMEEFLGGKGLNQALALKKAYDDVWLVANIHKNDRSILDELEKAKINTSHVSLLDSNTGTAFIQVDKSGENCILLNKGANHCFTLEKIVSIFDQCDANDRIVLQNEINHLDTILMLAHTRNIPVVLNPSPMDENILALPFELLDMLIVNEVEIMAISGCDDPIEGLDFLSKKYQKVMIVLTLGANGVYVENNNQRIFLPSNPVEAVDTTAAGDTFLGYFVASIMRKQTISDALKVANTAAGISVTRKGASSSIPDKEEVNQALNQ